MHSKPLNIMDLVHGQGNVEHRIGSVTRVANGVGIHGYGIAPGRGPVRAGAASRRSRRGGTAAECTAGQNTGENSEHQRCSHVDGAKQSPSERTPAPMTRAPSRGTEDHSAPKPERERQFQLWVHPCRFRPCNFGTSCAVDRDTARGSLRGGGRGREVIPRSRDHSSFGRGSDFRNSTRSDLSWSDSPRLKQLS